MNSRRCECGITVGISSKGFTPTKIFQCEKHGFICPFDSWQFKYATGLMEHLQNPSQEVPLHCEGWFNHGCFTVNEAIYELKVYLQKEKGDTSLVQ